MSNGKVSAGAQCCLQDMIFLYTYSWNAALVSNLALDQTEQGLPIVFVDIQKANTH